jgi:hypothetical protein
MTTAPGLPRIEPPVTQAYVSTADIGPDRGYTEARSRISQRYKMDISIAGAMEDVGAVGVSDLRREKISSQKVPVGAGRAE